MKTKTELTIEDIRIAYNKALRYNQALKEAKLHATPTHDPGCPCDCHDYEDED